MSGGGFTEVVVVSWRSAPLVEALAAGLRRRAAGRLRFTVVDNTGGEDGELAAVAERAGLSLLACDTAGLVGSRAHAAGLARGVAAATGRHVLLCDPDVHVFLDAWDRRLGALLDPSTVAAGAPYPWWKLGKVHDFPGPFFLLARRRDLLELGNDWTPFASGAVRRGLDRLGRTVIRLGGLATRRRLLARPGLARLAQSLEGTLGVRAPDTGYRVAAAARNRGLACALLPAVEPAAAVERWGATSGLATLAREFELFRLGLEPAVVHRYSSGARPWRTAGGGDEESWRRALAQAESELAGGGDGAS